MSVPTKGKSSPKLGKVLSHHAHLHRPSADYAAVISNALRAEVRGSNKAIKTLMRWTGASERTVKGWLSGLRGPNGEDLIALIGGSDILLRRVLHLAGRDPILDRNQLLELKAGMQQASEVIDKVLSSSIQH